MPPSNSRNHLTLATAKFARQLRNTWQMYFLPAALAYGISLMDILFNKPSPRSTLIPYLKNIDIAFFAAAIAIVMVIFNWKRIYFARRFIRQTAEKTLLQNREVDSEELLGKVFAVLRQKMGKVWLLGLLLVFLGVCFHWLTYSPGNNLHVYFMVGAFSLIINYPRQELFADIPWYVLETMRDEGIPPIDKTSGIGPNEPNA